MRNAENTNKIGHKTLLNLTKTSTLIVWVHENQSSFDSLGDQSESTILEFGLIFTPWYDEGSWLLKLNNL